MVTIAASSIAAAYEAIERLLHPHPVSNLITVAAAAVVGFAANKLVARNRIRVDRKIGSLALVADGLHARTDGFTSLAVFAILIVLCEAAREVLPQADGRGGPDHRRPAGR